MIYTNQDERRSRAAKIATGAAVSLAGIYMLNKSGGTKVIAKAFSDSSKAFKYASKEISKLSFKEMDADNLSRIAKRAVLDEDSIFKLARQNTKDIDISTSGNNLFSSLLTYNNLKKGNSYLQEEFIDSAMKTRIRNEMVDSYKDETKSFFKKMDELISESLDNKGKFFRQNSKGEFEAIKDRFDEITDGSIIEEHSEKMMNQIQDALNHLENSGVRDKLEQEYQLNMKGQIAEQYKNNMLEMHKPKEDFFSKVQDQAATVNDLLKAIDEDKVNISNLKDSVDGSSPNDLIDTLRNLVDENEEFGKLVVDNATLKMHNGELYSTKAMQDAKDAFKDEIADTVPGKLFSMRAFIDKGKAPDFTYLAKGSYDPNLAKAMGSESGVLEDNFFYIGNKFYKFENNDLRHVEKLDDLELISGRHGSFNVYNNRIHGNFYTKEQNNKFLNRFDINTTGETVIDDFKNKVLKFKSDSSWIRNVSKRFRSMEYDDINKFEDDLFAINEMFSSQMPKVSDRTVDQLKGVLGKDANKILEALDHEDPLKYLNEAKIPIKNLDLKSIMNSYIKDERSFKSTVKIGDLGGLRGLNILKSDDLLKREIVKSALLEDALANNNSVKNLGFAQTLEKIQLSNLNGNDKRRVSDMLHWVNIQNRANVYNSTKFKVKTEKEVREIKDLLHDLMNKDSSNAQVHKYQESMRNGISRFAKENSSLKDAVREPNGKITKAFKNNDWVTIRKTKTINANQIIEDINNGLKKDGDVRKFTRQFFAGRNNPEDMTMATLFPYHMVSRLLTPMEKFGIGFGPKNTGSVGDLTKNLILKRVLPIVGIAYAASYLNYESEKLTGTSFTEARENSKARMRLGFKRFQETIGYADTAKRNRLYNPITQYLFGDYKDAEEYQDYLQNGYDPVRKGRWWSFGSTSEFRGGKISYWEPNKLRQAHSHYRDIAIYGSEDEKWKHSLFPTLRYPLSPLRYLMNPYWVEDMHYNDRPYPVSGKMFAEGTPWGAILNPTIGAIIKPQIMMHKDELRNGDMTDPRYLVAERNKAIMNESAEANVVRLDKDGATPMFFAPKGKPSLSEAVFSMQIDGNKINVLGYEGSGYADSLGSIEDAKITKASDVTNNADGVGPATVNGMVIQRGDNDSANVNRLGVLIGLISSGSVDTKTASNMVASINRNTMQRAESYKGGVIVERARLHTVPYTERAAADKQKFIQSLNLTSKADTVHDLLYSGKELAGMYGFLFDQVIPEKKGYRLAQAGTMTSMSRDFWDSGYGGLGGDFMEIARRFFPHEDHNIEDVNPLKNTMPAWLPDRFWTGDPYTKLPKGEARLPGAGYEALNKLHPDKYGRYGAFDRYKILADVAPTSEEYKIWKKIAREDIKDPALLKQMKQIEERVKQQSKEHDFYDYRFLHKKMTDTKAVISEVDESGRFKVVGDNKAYSIAGLDFKKNDDKDISQFLRPGMIVDLSYEDNPYRNVSDDGTISAIIKAQGENINEQLWHAGIGEQKDEDKQVTLADKLFATNGNDMFMGHIYEAIGHAPIPYFHNKYLRINSPLESYKHEQVYGKSYATWDHPIEGFIKPTFREAWSRGPGAQALAVGTWALSEYMRTTDASKSVKTMAHMAFAMSNPAAFAGGLMGALPRMSLSEEASVWNAKNGARVGAAVGAIGYGLTHLDNPFLSVANFAVAGSALVEHFKPTYAGKKLGGKEGLLIGAAVGLGLSALKNPEFSLNKLTEQYIPEDTKKKWEIEEYYDRLEYLKYMNLYNRAARRALIFEKTDVKKVIRKFEYNQKKNVKKIEKLQKQKQKADKFIIDQGLKGNIDNIIDSQIAELNTPEQYFKAGKYTKAALAYKKAADTTIYGLNNFSSSADVLRALPKYDRDYFLEFAKEKDPKARKKLLKYISPYKQKALKILWGEKVENEESNKKFFSTHNLPGLFWAGWRPDVDLENVKLKTIENEGMMLSDFGMYDSNKTEPAVQAAPEIRDIHRASSPMGLQSKLYGMLSGLGLDGLDISVEPSANRGLNIITNIIKTGNYDLQNTVNSILYSSLL